jgi:hypothetical protein
MRIAGLDIRGLPDEAPLEIFSEWQAHQMPDLEAAIDALKPRLVVIDSLTAVNPTAVFSENDTEYARPILQLAALADKHQTTVVIIHHSNAEGNARGSRAIHNSVSEVWGLSVADGGDRLLRVQKTRMGRPPGRYKFAFDEDDFSFRYLGEENAEENESAATHEDRIRLWLSEDEHRWTRYTSMEIAEFLGITRHQTRRACCELWAKGLIKRVRPRRQKAYLYYFGGTTDTTASVFQNTTSDRAIVRDCEDAIGDRDNEGEVLNAMRSCDREKFENSNSKISEISRSHDRIVPVSDRVVPVNEADILHEGDVIIPLATATWYCSGSDKLPWREVPPSRKGASSIPINVLSSSLFHEMQDPSLVLAISKDGQRVKVRNQRTGLRFQRSRCARTEREKRCLKDFPLIGSLRQLPRSL